MACQLCNAMAYQLEDKSARIQALEAERDALRAEVSSLRAALTKACLQIESEWGGPYHADGDGCWCSQILKGENIHACEDQEP